MITTCNALKWNKAYINGRLVQWRSQEVEVVGEKWQSPLPSLPLPSLSPALANSEGVRETAVSFRSGVWGGTLAASDFGAF